MQIRRDLGAALSTPAEAWHFAQRLLGLHHRALPLYEGLDPKDKGPADDLIVLAAEAVLCCGPQLGPTSQEPSANGAHSSMGASNDQRDQVQAAQQQQRARQVALLRALLLLEVGQQRVTHTASLRLAATAVCGLLGAPQMAVEHFKMLDCKHIQTDTITSGHPLVWLSLCRRLAAPMSQAATAACAQ